MVEIIKMPLDDATEANCAFWTAQVDQIGRAYGEMMLPYCLRLENDPGDRDAMDQIERLRGAHREQIKPVIKLLVAIEARRPAGIRLSREEAGRLDLREVAQITDPTPKTPPILMGDFGP